MKYLNILLVFAFVACSTNSDQNDEVESTTDAVEEVAPEMDSVVVVQEVMVKESDIDQQQAVRDAFMNMVEVVNNADGSNPQMVSSLLDKEYVFRGDNVEESIARIERQFSTFKTTLSNVEIRGVEASCDLAYLIASYQKSMETRATGDLRVDAIDKVGLFILRKDSNGQWKLLVQKTDKGFAHWFYMPQDQ